MRPRVLIPLALLVVALGVGVWMWRSHVGAERERTAIRGSGIIEVTQVQAAFEVSGRIVERYVDEGMLVDGGEPIARLDEREYELAVQRAAAAKAGAEARYRMMVQGTREQEVDQALAEQQSAESTLRLAQIEYDRIAKLAREGIVSQNDLDQANTNLSTERQARDRAAAHLDMLREG